MSNLSEAIEVYRNKRKEERTRELKRKLVDLGILPNLDGFGYIVSSVMHMQQEKMKIMKLYKLVAETHSTTKSKVERAIRHAISVAWNKNSISEKYTVSEFLSLLAEDLL